MTAKAVPSPSTVTEQIAAVRSPQKPVVGAACSNRLFFPGSDTETEAFSYEGNGSSPRQISFSVSNADVIILYRADNLAGETMTRIKGVDSVFGVQSMRMGDGAGSSLGMVSINSLGMIIQSLINTLSGGTPNTFHGVAIKSPLIKSFAWTGSALDQTFTCGFAPLVVWAGHASNGSRAGIFKTIDMPGAMSMPMDTGPASGLVSGQITALGANDFTVAGGANSVNDPGAQHYGIAFGDLDILRHGTYEGNGIARTILNESCVYAWVGGDLAEHKVNRVATTLGTISKEISNTNATDLILSGGIDSMNPLMVGTDVRVNQAAGTPDYYWFAFIEPDSLGLEIDTFPPNSGAVLPPRPRPTTGTVSR